MAKLKDFGNGYFLFWCQGCKEPHSYQVPLWTWNGSMEAPTFTPSLLIFPYERSVPPRKRCHLFVTDGKIQFCGDSQHVLAGKMVDMLDWDEAAKGWSE